MYVIRVYPQRVMHENVIHCAFRWRLS